MPIGPARAPNGGELAARTALAAALAALDEAIWFAAFDDMENARRGYEEALRQIERADVKTLHQAAQIACHR